MSGWGDTLWDRSHDEPRPVVRPDVFRPLAPLSAWVVPLVIAAVAVSVIAVLNQIHKTALDGRLLDNALRVSASDVTRTYHRQVVLNRWAVVCMIAAGVVFLIWLHRAASNARAAGRFSDSPGLAVGSWFIPIVNLVLPVVVVLRLMRASRPEPYRLLLTVWWSAWLLGTVIGLSAASIGGSGKALVDIHSADRLWVVSIAARIAAGILLVLIVRLITAGQDHWPAGGHERSNQDRLFEYSAGEASASRLQRRV